MWEYVRCPALPHSVITAVLLESSFSSMILASDLEKKPTTPHSLTICFSSTMSHLLTSVWLPICWRYTETLSWFGTKVRNKTHPSSRKAVWNSQCGRFTDCTRVVENNYQCNWEDKKDKGYQMVRITLYCGMTRRRWIHCNTKQNHYPCLLRFEYCRAP